MKPYVILSLLAIGIFTQSAYAVDLKDTNPFGNNINKPLEKTIETNLQCAPPQLGNIFLGQTGSYNYGPHGNNNS